MAHESDNTLDQSDAADPQQIERWLGQAYDAPPLPRSLLKRLDQGIQQQWGLDPELSATPVGKLGRSAGKLVDRVRAWPMITVAAVVLCSVILFSDSGGFTWAGMLEALERERVVRILTAGDGELESGWISVPAGIVSGHSAGGTRLLDFTRGEILTRATSETTTFRQSFETAGATSADGLLSLLLGYQATTTGQSRRAPELRIVSEDWARIDDGPSAQIELRVRVALPDSADTSVKVVARLDPSTSLPQWMEVTDDRTARTRELTLSYPDASPGDLIARDFGAKSNFIDQPASGAAVTAMIEPAAVAAAASTGRAVAPESVVRAGDSAAGTSRQQTGPAPSVRGAYTLNWSSVAPPNLPLEQIVAQIDSALLGKWFENDITPAVPATDEELLRRCYLDLAGRIPTVHEVRQFAANRDPNRFDRLVDQLLSSRDHSTHLATVWRTFLLPEGVDLSRFGGTEAFDRWLSEQFRQGTAYDEIVRKLLLAEGRLTQSGPLLFYTAAKLDADRLAARTARVFLGMRLECAQCHDDPFEPWTQEDFWSYAAFFARISRPQGKLDAVSTVMRVRDIDRGDVMLPGTQTVVLPRFLDGSAIDETLTADSRRQQLADWLTATDNPFFARATVNRVWAHLFGRGLLHPVDGFGAVNQPALPGVLDTLAGYFVETGFSIHELFRAISRTQAYRLSSGDLSPDPQRRTWFAQMNVKTLTAEQIFDCISVATMPDAAATPASGAFALSRVGNTSRDAFLQVFRTPAGQPTEFQSGIPQALTLMNGDFINGATGAATSGLIKSLEAPFFTNDQRIEVLFLATLSRQPKADEWTLFRSYIRDSDHNTSLNDGLGDILWALLNSAEFTMNH